MKYHPILKGLAIFLAALAVLAGLVSGTGIALVASNGLYTGDVASWQERHNESIAYSLAWQVLRQYTAQALGECSTEALGYIGLSSSHEELSFMFGVDSEGWDYAIQDTGGNFLETTYTGKLQKDDVLSYTYRMSCDYPVDVTADELESFDDSLSPYRDYYVTETNEHYLYYFQSPEYIVTVRMLPGTATYSGMTMEQVIWLYEARNLFIVALASCIAVFILCLVYLCFAAGKARKGGAVMVKGLNRLPLDLYLGIAILAVLGGGSVFIMVVENWSFSSYISREILVLTCLAILAAAGVVVAFLYALAAQFKVPDHYWWRNSIVGRLCKLLGWGIRFLYRGVRKLFYMLPLIWQWLATAAFMVVVPIFSLLLAINSYGFGEIFWVLATAIAVLADIATVLYGAYAFGLLLKGAKAMAAGDLNAKIPTEHLIGSFKEFANHLNSLSEVAIVAAKKQMQSERMKTELITNVSHDIKTPLTSIINYVDLLEKPHTEEEGTQYLDVLSRQSLRLKKLIDDLMEMSKASTGSMNVNITPLDLVESINQALGEFSDKLAQENLQVVFRQPEHPIAIQADGRLTWRVLSNLLSNVVKYALPGTRVYIDVARYQNSVLLSLKNISREELNVSADELTERFVRGDASRNTEGSGLGLNIAQSLMELQKGQLNLLVDGDLFKVTLSFPSL